METRVVGNFERILVSTVNGIEHIESQSLNGIAVVKIFLQPGADIDGAISQTTSSARSGAEIDAAGHFPAAGAAVQRFERADSCKSRSAATALSEQQLFDLATNNLRPGMATVPGRRFRIPTAASCGK